MSCVANFVAPLALGALVLGSPAAQGATVPFSLQGDLRVFLTSAPSANATTAISGLFSSVPFGDGTVSGTGKITFATFPSGVLSPTASTNEVTYTFANGATLREMSEVSFSPPDPSGNTTSAETYKFLGGTGIFAGATGSGAGSGSNVPPSGRGLPAQSIYTISGLITAPASAVPEPATGSLLMVGLAGLALRRFGREGKQRTQPAY